MKRSSIIAIAIAVLSSADVWGQTSGTASASTRDQISAEQHVSAQTPTSGTRASTTEDGDLARIPTGPKAESADGSRANSAGVANERIYLEDAYTQTARRSGLIVSPPQSSPLTAWQERLFLDFRKVWRLDDRLTLNLSDRLNIRAENDISAPNHENLINDFREGFVSWQPHEGIYLDLGRINLRSGAALGFNPTDFFKTRAVVELLSADPSVLREDRLGTLMLEAQYIGHGRALTVAVAPALVRPSAIYTGTNLPSFNPSIDRTNDHNRLLIKGSFSLGSDFSPELLYYREGSQNKFGVNLTHGFGQKVIAYAEWAAGEGSNLIGESLRYGRETGTLPANAPGALPDDTRVHLQNDFSAGASYTTSKKVTFNLEYHLHQAGFSRQDWRNWFNIGRGQPATSPIDGELWYMRAYALDQQVPFPRQSAFLRADWVDAFIPNLEITGFINTDVYDGSSLIQASAEYYISRSWTIGTQVNANAGSRHSDFGSLPQSVGVLVKLARYF